ncbi:hypothetical protein [Anaerocolumna chitinilytica]|uniref:Uncharacterized protein n=1 Tax=Anaerocolumna chitinilytica TaxID=1727145 RepID=A0A7I8DRM1_9FIRM|nr:hypothetical protein [Anaerocolumna chitinilytica]BCK00338.1 hypothetical protein bsdcttw_33780 [Anaerocolumna chitinilytica]
MRKKEEIDFAKIFKGKKVPIVVLDERWHQLFPDYDKPNQVKVLESNLNEVIKQQGKLTNDLKDLKKLKNQLMGEIITHMDVSDTKEGKIKEKKLDQNQRLIREIGDKIKEAENQLIDLPYQIKEANEQLIIESTAICYKRLSDNTEKITEINQWIKSIREQLKIKILEKQDMEMKNTDIYNYMHDMLGPELLQELDEDIKKGLN